MCLSPDESEKRACLKLGMLSERLSYGTRIKDGNAAGSSLRSGTTCSSLEGLTICLGAQRRSSLRWALLPWVFVLGCIIIPNCWKLSLAEVRF